MSSDQIARYIIGFSWLYHGIFPKLLQIAPLEKAMTASLGFSDETSYFITKSAGVGELIFGLIFILFYKNRIVILLNITGLTGLLLFVAILQPQLLIGAFNPVTTNIPLIGLSFILLASIQARRQS
ncbi:DoxX-like family protein [Shewanella sp. OMA3-2]|uniref:DoxX-like family protein n=1 Tax=Shewanella sp. OMA3-2 TaxID=2908650 RepID=UPI001F24152B|nr:DoxX-like family protein [Shewanella sp. OMA3-2]UJF21658.1 DoxX-like family protein [Shewanella sp. OMA3-2]